MRILLLGAKGQVGSEISRAFAAARNSDGIDFVIVAADRKDLDLSNVHKIGPFLKMTSPDFIINAAAYTAVDKAESEKVLASAVNFEAVREIVDYCSDVGVPFLHISTDYVFDGNGDEPFSESDDVGPISVYGKSKLAGERIIRERLSAHIILRTAWVFGMNGNNFVKTMLGLAKDKSELSIVSDQVGSPTSARAIADAISYVVLQMAKVEADDERWGTYHFSGLPFVSWADFADDIFDQASQLGVITRRPKVNRISTVEYPTPATRPANSRLNSSKFKESFSIDPDDWRQSLHELLKHIKDSR